MAFFIGDLPEAPSKRLYADCQLYIWAVEGKIFSSLVSEFPLVDIKICIVLKPLNMTEFMGGICLQKIMFLEIQRSFTVEAYKTSA